VKAVFADTFYWTALSRSLLPDKIVTTDEVLDEYLAYF